MCNLGLNPVVHVHSMVSNTTVYGDMKLRISKALSLALNLFSKERNKNCLIHWFTKPKIKQKWNRLCHFVFHQKLQLYSISKYNDFQFKISSQLYWLSYYKTYSYTCTCVKCRWKVIYWGPCISALLPFDPLPPCLSYKFQFLFSKSICFPTDFIICWEPRIFLNVVTYILYSVSPFQNTFKTV